mmetsp:Transcript_53721/g.156608  ORF Transcript_53721/g.156608 Transcript_53721/m.156608 type:complete len:381 (+) Transcript_53721:35-1177(+)
MAPGDMAPLQPPDGETPAEALPAAPLEELLTILLVTSPIRSHPSTEMLEWTLGSYVEKAGLASCPKIIVSDGFTVAGPGQKERPKSGRVPLDWVSPYAEFRARVDALVAAGCEGGERGTVEDGTGAEGHQSECNGADRTFSNCRHVRMEQHKGFGGCTYCALRLVATPYVLVLQHDRPCLRSFEAARLVSAMEASQGAAKYVGLPTKASLARIDAAAVMSRCHLRLEEGDVDERVAAAAAASGVDLRVLLFWYDSSHVCRVSHYRDFVFARGRVPGGGFPEDSFGQAMHAEISAAAQAGDWQQAHAAYGTYLLVDGGGPMVGHLRGRRFIETAELQQQGWCGPQKVMQAPGLRSSVRQADEDDDAREDAACWGASELCPH